MAHVEPFLWALAQVAALLLLPFAMSILFIACVCRAGVELARASNATSTGGE